MHAEAYEGFAWALERSGLDRSQPWRVLDIGGQMVNGSVHDQLPQSTVTTLDLENADIIADARTWEPTHLFDVVIATEVFEHVHNWGAVLDTMRKALDPEGPGTLITTCASTNRQPHGATGAPAPAPYEYYGNVEPIDLELALRSRFAHSEVRYLYPPGDAYAWARMKPMLGITVIIPTVPVPSRQRLLDVAMASVEAQTLKAESVITCVDHDRQGPSMMRNNGIALADTEWIAFLDDDDYLHPEHLDTMARAAIASGADIIWPWFAVDGGTDPFPHHRGRQWDPQDPHQIPITVLVRKSALDAVGGFNTVDFGPTDKGGNRAGEDWDLWLRLSAAGYKFHHVPDQTWVWRHWGGNSSGLPERIDWSAV